MNAPTDVQIIHGPDGEPAFVVIPYQQYIAQQGSDELIPHAVVSRIVDGATPIRAWREHLNQALAVLHTAREPDSRMAEVGDADTWERMVDAAIQEAEATAE